MGLRQPESSLYSFFLFFLLQLTKTQAHDFQKKAHCDFNNTQLNVSRSAVSGEMTVFVPSKCNRHFRKRAFINKHTLREFKTKTLNRVTMI